MSRMKKSEVKRFEVHDVFGLSTYRESRFLFADDSGKPSKWKILD
jgi:hypothetical protein